MRKVINLTLFIVCLFVFTGCSYEEEFSAYEEIDELANKYFEAYIGEGESSTSLGAHNYTADMNIDDVLRKIAYTKKVKFAIEGRTLKVMKQ